ncbi:DUF1345 domain-containing protein [Sphingomonas naphthae]|uniref:DUF1345 domain-containing protein n=1 Tax=Sphingomonas naphthae TaxID=1813468 RepID=A0ABY7TI93_9SPHN|nr:DUF1345 domain-containing protein [Sphingomonas naphthae]WCT72447.1 DUF1345 domain-containing protein [Sphingomonas naphthae]
MTNPPRTIGNRIAPARFVAFVLVAIAGVAAGTHWLGWAQAVMAGFDLAGIVFLLSCIPLLDADAGAMRAAARRNDANRALLLALTGFIILTILVSIGIELGAKGAPDPLAIALVIATLVIAWLFSNMVYALHYAHIFYSGAEGGGDSGGIDLPDTKEPDYWDFAYFAFTLGMTFQTSDISITSRSVRRVVLFHCFAAFVFNIGVLAFTINVLGGGG